MRCSVGLPTTRVDAPDEFLSGRAIAEMASTAEQLGFDAVYVTDHPAGDQKWLETGGHHALDPFVALSFAAAATTRLRVQTHILVLAYRNPFLTAKSLLSLDVLSGGRVILGVAAGYLRSEFNALGVDYEERNELFDEALEVVKLALTQDAVAYEGRHFRSRGTTMRPRPVQQPRPPLWVGGNSTLAMRKAVEAADGWCPFPNPAATSAATKTPALASLDDLAARLQLAREHAVKVRRDAPLDVCFAPVSMSMAHDGPVDLGAVRDELAALEALGVTQTTIGVEADDRATWLRKLETLAASLL